MKTTKWSEIRQEHGSFNSMAKGTRKRYLYDRAILKDLLIHAPTDFLLYPWRFVRYQAWPLFKELREYR